MYILRVAVGWVVDKYLDYLSDIALKVGTVVFVEVNNKLMVGVVLENLTSSEFSNLKKISKVVAYNLQDAHIEFLQLAARYNISSYGAFLKLALPQDTSFYEAAQKKRKQFDYSSTASPTKIALNDEQKACLDALIAAKDKYSVHVLKGVTGSGKTEVFLEFAHNVISSGKQVMILMPEIFLTSQMYERFKSRLDEPIYLWHSGVSKSQKKDTFRKIISGEAKFVLGARSALFLPFNKLGLIVIDEEHDSSYKQEEQTVYNARDMGVLRAQCENIPILLSSATPAVETEYNILIKKYIAYNLNSRYGNAALPKVEIIAADSQKDKMLCAKIVAEINQVVKEGKQVLIYLNKRGYVPVTYCKSCNETLICPNCDFNLVYHKSLKLLKCHHCNFSHEVKKGCLSCKKADDLSSYGFGVEKLAEEVKKIFKDYEIQILSSDNVKDKNRDEIIEALQDNKFQILIGTQLIGKGLHFPNIELVVILDLDNNAFSGDIRSHERMYQMVMQVSGRAGRASEKGKVLIQTAQTDSIFIQDIKSANFEKFIKDELDSRKEANMPPFSRIVHTVFSSRNHQLLLKVINKARAILPTDSSIRILGPMPAPIFYLKNQYRYRIIFIAAKSLDIQSFVKAFISELKLPKNIKVKIDVDAISLF